jgi:hypothetical protein
MDERATAAVYLTLHTALPFNLDCNSVVVVYVILKSRSMQACNNPFSCIHSSCYDRTHQAVQQGTAAIDVRYAQQQAMLLNRPVLLL